MMEMVIFVLCSILAILFTLKLVKYDMILYLIVTIGLVLKLIEFKELTTNDLLFFILPLEASHREKLKKIKNADGFLVKFILVMLHFRISFFLFVEVLSTIDYFDNNTTIPYPAIIMILFIIFIMNGGTSYSLRGFVEENENKEWIKEIFLKYKTYDSF